jgi:hypothetical protein
MTAAGQTGQTTNSWDAGVAWSDLEVPIREVAYMAGIVRDLVWELLDGESPTIEGGDGIVRMSHRQHEQLTSIAQKALDMALESVREHHV